MSLNNTLAVDIYTLATEQRQQLFLSLFDADPNLLNALNPEQRCRFYAVLIVIDPSLAGSLDARSAIHRIANEQVKS